MVCVIFEKNAFEIETYFIKEFDSINNGLNSILPCIGKTYQQKEFICPYCYICYSLYEYLQNHTKIH